MKKIISVLLAVLMIFSAVSVMASAAGSYTVTFTDTPYDTSPYRTDYIGNKVGFEFGVDYWFVITNKDGTTTEVKGQQSFTVKDGDSIEFTVAVADYMEDDTVRVLTYPATTPVADLFNATTGIPNTKYYIAKSTQFTYGVRPTENMMVCLSEYHLYNDCFNYKFPTSSYYSTQRVDCRDNITIPEDKYAPFDWDNNRVIYINEPVYFEVKIPTDDSAHVYHYDTFEVYYTTGTMAGKDVTPTYLKQNAVLAGDGTEISPAINKLVATYETDTDVVYIYRIDNADPTMKVHITGVVTYSVSMLGDLVDSLVNEDISLEDIDLDSIDLDPIANLIMRILIMLTRIFKGFGLNLDLTKIFN